MIQTTMIIRQTTMITIVMDDSLMMKQRTFQIMMNHSSLNDESTIPIHSKNDYDQ